MEESGRVLSLQNFLQQPKSDLKRTSKWKLQKYSRTERKRRLLNIPIKGQTLITDYCQIIDEVQHLITKNQNLKDTLLAQIEALNDSQNNNVSDCNGFLHSLMNSAHKNSGKQKSGHRYDESLKLFATYLFTVGGRSLYETLEKNLQGSLPSISTVERAIRNYNEPIKEGEFRFHQLQKYLEDRALPNTVWISEDATRITGKVQYDPRFNQISGFTLPLNEQGVPVCDSYPATYSKEIEDYFKTGTTANYAYVIMAQPLQDGVTAFCLAFFGSDNRFTAEDVLRRWQWMKEQAAEHGIRIIGFSSDGDTRLLKAMKFASLSKNPLVPEKWQPFFVQSPSQTDIFVQDTVHILTKLRTRF